MWCWIKLGGSCTRQVYCLFGSSPFYWLLFNIFYLHNKISVIFLGMGLFTPGSVRVTPGSVKGLLCSSGDYTHSWLHTIQASCTISPSIKLSKVIFGVQVLLNDNVFCHIYIDICGSHRRMLPQLTVSFPVVANTLLGDCKSENSKGSFICSSFSLTFYHINCKR